MSRKTLFGIALGVTLLLAALLAVACSTGFPGIEYERAGVGAATLPVGAQTVTVGSLSSSPVTITWTTAYTNGNWCNNDGDTFLLVKNDSASPVAVTVQTPLTVGGLAVADRVFTVTNGTQYVAGPFNPLWFNELSGSDKDKMSWTYNAGFQVSVAAFSWR